MTQKPLGQGAGEALAGTETGWLEFWSVTLAVCGGWTTEGGKDTGATKICSHPPGWEDGGL